MTGIAVSSETRLNPIPLACCSCGRSGPMEVKSGRILMPISISTRSIRPLRDVGFICAYPPTADKARGLRAEGYGESGVIAFPAVDLADGR